MLLNLMIFLLGLALVSVIWAERKMPYLWPLLLIAAMFAGAMQLFAENSLLWSGGEYPWLRFIAADFVLSFKPTAENLPVLQAIWLLTLLALLGNFSNREEKKSHEFGGLLLLNLLCLFGLLLSRDYAQTLLAVCLCDVLVFGMINDFAAKRKYIYANFLADMLIVNIAAMLMANGAGTSFEQLQLWLQGAEIRQNWLPILWLLAIFAKIGLFLFQSIYLEIAPLSFSRLQPILYLTSPLIGYILLKQSQGFWQLSSYTQPLLLGFSMASVLWGAMGFALIDSLKRKAVYLAMMFWGAAVYLAPTISWTSFVALLASAYVFAQCVTLVAAAAKENYASEISRLGRYAWFTFMLSLLLLWTYLAVWSGLVEQYPLPAAAFIGLLVLVFARFCRRVYWPSEKTPAVLPQNPMPLFSLVLWAVAVSILLFSPLALGRWTLTALLFWALCLWPRPLQCAAKLATVAWLQESDYISAIADLLIITPLKIVSRLLWLMVDFVLIERTIISFLHSIFDFLVALTVKLNSGRCWSNLFMLLLGAAIVAAFWLKGGQ